MDGKGVVSDGIPNEYVPPLQSLEQRITARNQGQLTHDQRIVTIENGVHFHILGMGGHSMG